MHLVFQRFAPRPVTLVTVVALAFVAVMFVATSTPAAAQTRPASTPTRAATPARPAATAVRPAATAVRPAPTAARPGAVMPRAGGGGMATNFVDGGASSGYGLWLGLAGVVAVGGAGVFYARRLRFASDRVLLH